MSTTLVAEASVAVPHRGWVRGTVVLALLAGAVGGVAIGHAAPTRADIDLLRLLRAMAVLKLLFVGAAAGAILWRLQAPVRPAWLLGYVATCAAMAAGPGLIWFGAQVASAAFLLHLGIAAAVVLLWQDRTTSILLADAVQRRRRAHGA